MPARVSRVEYLTVVKFLLCFGLEFCRNAGVLVDDALLRVSGVGMRTLLVFEVGSVHGLGGLVISVLVRLVDL